MQASPSPHGNNHFIFEHASEETQTRSPNVQGPKEE
jgi:hypothetical protein